MLGMKTNINNLMKYGFRPRRWVVAIVAFLLAGNLSPFGMRALDYLNIDPPWADITLSMALFAIAGVIYCMLRHMYLK